MSPLSVQRDLTEVLLKGQVVIEGGVFGNTKDNSEEKGAKGGEAVKMLDCRN